MKNEESGPSIKPKNFEESGPSIKPKNFKVYISGPISNLPFKTAEANFERAEIEALNVFCKFTNKEIEVINPMKLDHEAMFREISTGVVAWEECMVVDINELFKCDAIYMLNDWENSKGARIEFLIAKEMKLPMLFEVKKNII